MVILQKLKEEEAKTKSVLTQPNRPRALILVPNKELVSQTLEVIKDICHLVKLKAGGLCGSATLMKEKELLGSGVDVLVSTIDRFEKHQKFENVFISQL
jgi:superfamily II DNA/RNA helicase